MSRREDHIDLNGSPSGGGTPGGGPPGGGTPGDKEILRYLNREMSEEERYAFEKKMEADPFLYEAVQGLEGLNLAELGADLKSLKEQIRPRKKQPLPILRIAAALALLMVAGFSIWRLTISPLPKEELASETVVNPDTLVAVSESPAKNNEAAEEASDDPIARAATESPELEKPSEQAKAPAIAPQPTASGSSAGKPIVAGPEVADALTAEEQADITLDDETVLELAEIVTSEKLSTDDLILNELATGESLGFDEDSFASGGIAENEESREAIARAPAPALTEARSLATSEREYTKSMKKTSGAVSKSASREFPEAKDDASALNPELAAPESGWVNFASSIKNNQVVSNDMEDGKVGLRFSLDENGNPQAIEVINSLCGPCDAEAIRLLKASGKWAYNEGVTGRPTTFVYITIRK